MPKKLYLIVFVIVLLCSILFYFMSRGIPREFLESTSVKSNIKTYKVEAAPRTKKVKFLNTGLERVIDIDGNIIDKPVYIDVG